MQLVHVQTEGISTTEYLGESGPDYWPTFCGLIRKTIACLAPKILSFPSICLIWQLFGPKIGIKMFDPISVEALYINQFSSQSPDCWTGLWPYVLTGHSKRVSDSIESSGI